MHRIVIILRMPLCQVTMVLSFPLHGLALSGLNMAKVVALANVIMPTKNTEPMESDTVRKEVSSDEAADTLRGVIWLEPRRRKAR